MVTNCVAIIDDDKVRSLIVKEICNFCGFKTLAFDYKSPVDKTYQFLILGESNNAATSKKFSELKKLKIPIINLYNKNPCPKSDYFLKFPFVYSEFIDIVYNLKSSKTFYDETLSLTGTSNEMAQVKKLISQVAKTEASVLILGESGTGKEVVARNVHNLSKRSQKAFIPINCGAIPSELLESELFGHEKGAFTGAISARQGRFEMADNGTLFLDEIGDMPLNMQVKLLRVLQEKSFERIGSNKTMNVNVRIIAATHRKLENHIAQGKFREDLYYRLNVFPIVIPPLKERVQDIKPLFYNFVNKLDNKQQLHLLDDALEKLKSYAWPGNVRELANLVERLSILYPNGVISVKELPARFAKKDKSKDCEKHFDLKNHLISTEVSLIKNALLENEWVVSKAASFLKIQRTTLIEKIKKYGIVKS